MIPLLLTSNLKGLGVISFVYCLSNNLLRHCDEIQICSTQLVSSFHHCSTWNLDHSRGSGESSISWCSTYLTNSWSPSFPVFLFIPNLQAIIENLYQRRMLQPGSTEVHWRYIPHSTEFYRCPEESERTYVRREIQLADYIFFGLWWSCRRLNSGIYAILSPKAFFAHEP